jgi:hypothetical protein
MPNGEQTMQWLTFAMLLFEHSLMECSQCPLHVELHNASSFHRQHAEEQSTCLH